MSTSASTTGSSACGRSRSTTPARATIEVGTYFEYRDLESNELRVGYYHPETRRFTGLSDDEAIITTHLRCPESYVRNNLRGSTYA